MTDYEEQEGRKALLWLLAWWSSPVWGGILLYALVSQCPAR